MSNSNSRETTPTFISVEDFTHLQFIGLSNLPSQDTTGERIATEYSGKQPQRWSQEEQYLRSLIKSPYDCEMLTEFFNNLRSLEFLSSDPKKITLDNEDWDDVTDLMIEMMMRVKHHFEEKNIYIAKRLSYILHKAFGV